MKDKALSWPQFCRAQSAATAYEDALFLFERWPYEEAVSRVKEKLQGKLDLVATYKSQKDDERAAKENEEYHKQADEFDK